MLELDNKGVDEVMGDVEVLIILPLVLVALVSADDKGVVEEVLSDGGIISCIGSPKVYNLRIPFITQIFKNRA
jgi:hypothetical protein